VRAADGFLAERGHVERHLLLALADDHAGIENAGFHHGAQAEQELLLVELRGPGADGVVIVVQHTDQAGRQRGGFLVADVDGRARHAAGRGHAKIRKISLATRPAGRLRDMQGQRLTLAHSSLFLGKGVYSRKHINCGKSAHAGFARIFFCCCAA
jgi:hypothetical protein